MPGTTKLVSTVKHCQSVLIRKSTAFWSKVGESDDLRPSKEERAPTFALVMEVVEGLREEGWTVEVYQAKRMVKIFRNSTSYDKSFDWLLGCEYGDVIPPLENDLIDITTSMELC